MSGTVPMHGGGMQHRTQLYPMPERPIERPHSTILHAPPPLPTHLLMPTSPYSCARGLGKNRVVRPEPSPRSTSRRVMFTNPVSMYLHHGQGFACTMHVMTTKSENCCCS